MRLGIDFGTTRIVVTGADRGNYPVLTFETPDGSAREWFPPLVAVQGERRVYGWEAWAAQEEPGWTVVRSLKRSLETAGPETPVQIENQIVPMHQLLFELVLALRNNLLEHSSMPETKEESLQVMLGVPANANSNQRFLTAEAFRQAGFQVLGLLNEPSAASIEFGHRHRMVHNASERARILVYDLGGGTFDASLVEMDDSEHIVVSSEGIATLGGDDFDAVLAELALETAEVSLAEREGLSLSEQFRLQEQCREKKESLHPNTRRISIDLGAVRTGWEEVSFPVSDYYERCQALVEQTQKAVEDLLARNGGADQKLEALYVTGGGSELPLIARALRETYGRRVRRSAYTRSATAIGLAIQADGKAGYQLRDKFTRNFGVWRESEGGRVVSFDPLFPKGTPLPEQSGLPLVNTRQYSPVHNIGHFRYLECSRLAEDRRPAGDVTIWDDIRFPFDPSLAHSQELSNVPVLRSSETARQEVEEKYSCDANGKLAVTITNVSSGYSRQYQLGSWQMQQTTIVPGRRKAGSRRGSAALG